MLGGVVAVSQEAQDGEIVRVEADNGYLLGKGLYNSRSKSSVRMLTRDADAVIDDGFFKMRVENAIRYREKAVGLENCRLIFGEADRMPGLTVDKFADVLVTQTLSLGMEKLKDRIFAILIGSLAEHGHKVRGIYERNDARVRELEGLEREQGFWRESFDPCVRIRENGIYYDIDVSSGQKTGYFLDQRFNRMAIRPFAENARVLDCFCNAGGFALNALAGGAAHAIGADASQLAVDSARANVRRKRSFLPHLLAHRSHYALRISRRTTRLRSFVRLSLQGGACFRRL